MASRVIEIQIEWRTRVIRGRFEKTVEVETQEFDGTFTFTNEFSSLEEERPYLHLYTDGVTTVNEQSGKDDDTWRIVTTVIKDAGMVVCAIAYPREEGWGRFVQDRSEMKKITVLHRDKLEMQELVKLLVKFLYENNEEYSYTVINYRVI